MKKFVGGAVAAALLAALAACAPIGQDPGSAETELSCLPTERYLRLYVDAHREQNVVNDPQADIDIHADFTGTVQALSPAPGFQGIAFYAKSANGGGVVTNVGTITPGNPLIFDGQTPFHGAACWPAEYPVAFLLRATLARGAANAQDEVLCSLYDGHTLAGFLEEMTNSDYHRVELVDLIPGNAIQVQCVDYYVPGSGDWAGATLPTFNPLPRN